MIYEGNCHCGGYRFTLRADSDIKQVTECDCVSCKKQGFIWYIAADDAVQETRHDGTLVEYRSSSLKYNFCSVCGTGIRGEHLDGPLEARTVINIRCLRGIDPFDFIERCKTVQTEQSPLPSIGSCICGSVKVELLRPMHEAEFKEDNCSICSRNAWIGVYPSKSQVRVTGTEHVQEYRFGRRFMGHPFCKTCGVNVTMDVYGPPQQVIDRLPEDKKELVKKKLDVAPVNIRVLDNVDLSGLKIVRSNEGTDGYEKDVLGLEN